MSSTPKSADDILKNLWSLCLRLLADIEDAIAKGAWVHTSHDRLELGHHLYDLRERLGFAGLTRHARMVGFRLEPEDIETLILEYEDGNSLGKYDETQFSRLAA